MFWGVLTSLKQHLEILLSTWQGGQKIDMGRTKYTTAHLLRVKELLQAGFSTREIATKLSINKSSIAELEKWVPESEYVKRTPGRPLLLSLRQQALLTRRISKNPYTSATEASAYWL
ncbi:uncharacterized protein UHOD_20997 [Ustilago sp. UG-2017b]|nr:uncharacterized protein UHOD_20997 [Ustilago sp. UG-2017b]